MMPRQHPTTAPRKCQRKARSRATIEDSEGQRDAARWPSAFSGRDPCGLLGVLLLELALEAAGAEAAELELFADHLGPGLLLVWRQHVADLFAAFLAQLGDLAEVLLGPFL